MCVKMEDVKNNRKGSNILNAWRMMTIKDGEKKIETVLIEFAGEILPQKIYMVL